MSIRSQENSKELIKWSKLHMYETWLSNRISNSRRVIAKDCVIQIANNSKS